MIVEEETSPLLPKAAEAAVAHDPEEALIVSPPPPYSSRSAAAPAQCEQPPSTLARFIRAFIIASIIWSILVIPFRIGVVVISARWEQKSWEKHGWFGRSPSRDGVVERCSPATKWSGHPPSPLPTQVMPIIVKDSFVLPLSAQSISLFAHGESRSSYIGLTADESLDEGVVNITVQATTYAGNPVLDSAHVCLFNHGNGSTALGLFTLNSTSRPTEHKAISWLVNVRFPISATSYLRVNSFHSTLMGFEHHVGDLGGIIHFGNITFETGDGFIEVGTLTADHAQLHNIHGQIVGQFDVKKSLSLRSETGTIEGNIDLRPRSIPGNREASMDIYSASGNVSAAVVFGSNSLAPAGFRATAISGTGNIVIDFSDAPRLSPVNLSISALEGIAAVALPPLFQGQYILHSSGNTPKVLSRSVSGEPSTDYTDRDTLPLLHWHNLQMTPVSTLLWDQNSDPAEYERLHERKPTRRIPTGTLSQGCLYWQPRDPLSPTSLAWVEGRRVAMVT